MARRPVSLLLLFLFVALLRAAPLGADDPPDPSPPGSGRVAGRVVHRGAVAPAPPLPVERGPAACGKSVADERLIVGPGGGLANAVLQIEGAPAPALARSEPRGTLAIEGCCFRPHVQVLRVGQVLEVTSRDPCSHHLRGLLAGEETLFDLPLPIRHQVVAQKMKQAGVVHLEAGDGRPWMSAYLVVLDHPHAAVTGADGDFVVDQVPAGSYRLRVWHEALGTQEVPVTVVAGETARVELAYPVR